MSGRRLSDRVLVRAAETNQAGFSYDAFDEDEAPRRLWELDADEQRRRIAERAAKGARDTRRQQFGRAS